MKTKKMETKMSISALKSMLPWLLVCTVMSVTLPHPAFAQQSSSTAPAQGAAATSSQTASSDDREPIKADTPQNFWDGDDPNVVNLVTHPFASKKYVQRHVAPIRDRINELDELTSENGKAIKDVDMRAQQGIQLASEKSSLADQHANDAGNKAQLAQTAATQASARVASTEQMVGNLDQYKGTGQTEIRFRTGQTMLSKAAKDALDAMATPLKDQRSYIIEVSGYAPGRGQAAIASSQKMADSVVRYLVLSHQIPVYRIYVLSMGNAPAGGSDTAKRSSGGRVEVSLMRNDLMGSTQH
ncbi:MAG TPA: OmpA family protein [Candidatus Sulfotelmatobacter sp.]|jgi:outer membrane protein OmpA-like peptidoglycan-associated protein